MKRADMKFRMQNSELRIKSVKGRRSRWNSLLVTRYSSLITSQRGIALIMVIVLSAIALAIMAALLYMVMSRSQISGLQKRYKTSYEAGMGGASLTYEYIDLRGDAASDSSFDTTLNSKGINFVVGSSFITTPSGCQTKTTDTSCGPLGNYTGLATKLYLPTKCWLNCDLSQTIDPSTSSTYDFAFQLPGQYTNYNVYGKITDTVLGNSSGGEDLSVYGVVEPRTPKRQPIPYLYTIEVDSQNQSNPTERAKLSILYQY